jgi:2-C-methyl-D-erythritol 4-phosphate cytidylyltransferase
MVDFRVSVVLPAAGIGSRMGCDIPKQVRKVTLSFSLLNTWSVMFIIHTLTFQF